MRQKGTCSQGLPGLTGQDQGNSDRTGTERLRNFKRRNSLGIDGTRDETPKTIQISHLQTDSTNTAIFTLGTDHFMINTKIHNGKTEITTNAMIDSAATEDFIDYSFAMVHQLPLKKIKQPRNIYMVDGTVSQAGPITHTTEVPMDIGNHKEKITFLIARLIKHEVILGMPWLTNHQPRIKWGKQEVTFESERCKATCLSETPTVYAIPEEQALRENLKDRILEVNTCDGKAAVVVKKLKPEARIPTKGSKKAAGHDLYSMEEVTVPARGQVLIGTEIAIGLPENTYTRIAPRSGLASRNGITTNAGVIDADYSGEIQVLLANLSEKDHQIQTNNRIAQMIIEKIVMSDLQEVQELEQTERGQKGCGSTNEDSKRNKITEEKPLC